MSEPATPGDAGNVAAGDSGAALTPDAIEAVLADFRAWLTQLAQAAPEPVGLPPETVDLHTLVAQFTALRQEVNLQTRAVRAQQEQTTATLEQYGQLFQALEATSEQIAGAQRQEDDAKLAPLLKGMIEVADAQLLAARELQRVLQGVRAIVADAAEIDKPTAVTLRVPLLARLVGAKRLMALQDQWLNRLERRLASRHPEVGDVPPKLAETLLGRVEAATTGLAMGFQRIERVLVQHDLEPIPALGQPFDPERMEVLEVVHGSGKPTGEVVDEVRRGYLWRGRVFRFAQVKVAK